MELKVCVVLTVDKLLKSKPARDEDSTFHTSPTTTKEPMDVRR